MRFIRCCQAWIISGLLLTGMGCGDGLGPTPTTGELKVSVVTAGEPVDHDRDGYLIRFGPVDTTRVLLDETVWYSDIPVGTHLVRLEGVAANCFISGPAERSVEVNGYDTAAVSFAVSCVPNVGSVMVTTITTGSDLDADGYTLNSEFGSFPLLPNGTRTISGIRTGTVAVGLAGVAMNCKIDPPPPGLINVIFGTVELRYTIRCAGSGTLRITTSTTGFDFDRSGFGVSIVDLATLSTRSLRLPANGTYSLSPLTEGTYRLSPQLDSNCKTANSQIDAIVVAGAQTDVAISVSCDGAGRIAFVKGAAANADIFVSTASGAGLTRLTTGQGFDGEPAWSPDGRRIAFTTERDGNKEIYVMDSDGGNANRLTITGASDSRPAWSPDGSRIAFVSDREGNPDIHVMNSDGSDVINITKSNFFESDPAWSPDGTQIAFSTTRDGGGVWIMNVDGSQSTRVTQRSSDRQPAWSPDGKRIAFARDLSADTRDIFIIEVNGSLLTRLTVGLIGAGSPAWSPDGTRIVIAAITRDCLSVWDVYVYPCQDYLAIYLAAGGLRETLWSLVPATDPAWR